MGFVDMSTEEINGERAKVQPRVRAKSLGALGAAPALPVGQGKSHWTCGFRAGGAATNFPDGGQPNNSTQKSFSQCVSSVLGRAEHASTPEATRASAKSKFRLPTPADLLSSGNSPP
jgi:hypothetical protein